MISGPFFAACENLLGVDDRRYQRCISHLFGQGDRFSLVELRAFRISPREMDASEQKMIQSIQFSGGVKVKGQEKIRFFATQISGH